MAHFSISCHHDPGHNHSQPFFFFLRPGTFVVGRGGVNHGLASSALQRTGRQHDDAPVWAGRHGSTTADTLGHPLLGREGCFDDQNWLLFGICSKNYEYIMMNKVCLK